MNSNVKKIMCKDVSENDLRIGFAKTPPTFFSEPNNAAKLKSDEWNHFHVIRSLTGALVENWYVCQFPDCPLPFLECDTSNGGINTLKRHRKQKHSSVQTYKLTPADLFGALSAASDLGANYGKISSECFRNYVPPPNENWSLDFVNEIGQINQHEFPATAARLPICYTGAPNKTQYVDKEAVGPVRTDPIGTIDTAITLNGAYINIIVAICERRNLNES